MHGDFPRCFHRAPPNDAAGFFARPESQSVGYNEWTGDARVDFWRAAAFCRDDRNRANWGVDMKRIDEWEQFWSESQPGSRIERFAPLVAFGLAVIIAWL